MSRMRVGRRRGAWCPTPACGAGVIGSLAAVIVLIFAGTSAAATASLRPTVARITPALGTSSGGTRVTLTGTGLRGVREVRFGTARGRDVRVLSPRRLTVVTPRHHAGRVSVVVVGAHGASKVLVVDHFTYRSSPPAGGTIRILTGTGSQAAAVPGSALSSGVGEPAGLSVDPSTGNLYIADTDNNIISKVTPGGQLSFFAGEQPGIGGPATIGPATGTSLDMPQDVAFDTANGDVYIADSQTNEILQVAPTGYLTVIAGEGRNLPSFTPQAGTSVILGDPTGIAVDPSNGNVYVADRDDDDILQITPSEQLSIVAGQLPQDGAITNGSTAGPTPATQATLNNPQAVAVNPANGDLYVADTYDQEIDLVTPAGGFSVVAGGGRDQLPDQTPTPARDFRLSVPGGVAYDSANGDLYIADTADNHIDQVTPAGKLTLVAGAINPTQRLTSGADALDVGLDAPLGIAVDPSTGVLYIADTENDYVESVTPRR